MQVAAVIAPGIAAARAGRRRKAAVAVVRDLVVWAPVVCAMRAVVIGAHSAAIAWRKAKDESNRGWAAPLLGIALLFFATMTWAAAGNVIAVAYPDIGEPYDSIFKQIISGVEDQVNGQVSRRALRANTNNEFLKADLLQQKIKIVIALGRQGMKTITAVNGDIRLVVGGVLSVPEAEASAQPVLSLSPDPALLFARMKVLMPSAKRVFVVYDPGISAWLISLAREAASNQGVELVTREARDTQSAVQSYKEFFATIDKRRDVLWLPHDSTSVEERTIVPLVLKESWERDIAVFSSSAAHVQRGALFSLYPDNVALGKSLAKLAQGILSKGDYDKRGMLPLRDVLGSVNLRTVRHLGLPMPQQNFDTVFPEQ